MYEDPTIENTCAIFSETVETFFKFKEINQYIENQGYTEEEEKAREAEEAKNKKNKRFGKREKQKDPPI